MYTDGFKDDNVDYVSDVSEDDGDEDPGIGPDEVDDDEWGDDDTKMIVIMTDLEAHLVLKAWIIITMIRIMIIR